MDKLKEWLEIANSLYENGLDYTRLLPKFINLCSDEEIDMTVNEIFGSYADTNDWTREQKVTALARNVTRGWVFR